VVIFFDEADALFGKRSDVKDARDRYANQVIDYLQQRLESYPGIVILTSNSKQDFDRAWQRRLRYIVEFAAPWTQQKTGFWQRLWQWFRKRFTGL
jgi:SpoVK/Ycf46/Vps4 family AAA+-type ATPase